MIINEGGVGNVWYRAAVIWFMFTVMIDLLLCMILDEYKYDIYHLRWLAFILPLWSLVFWFVGRFLSDPHRILTFVMIMGLFCYLPGLVFLLIPLSALIFLTFGGSHGALCLGAACLILSVYWMHREVKGLKARIIKRKFVEIEFKIKPEYIVIKRSPHVHLELSQTKTGSMAEKVWDWLLPKLIFLMFMGSPMAQHFYRIGNMSAAMALLSCFSVPLAIHMLGELACGFYLWIYIVWKLEKQHGKPVIFV